MDSDIVQYVKPKASIHNITPLALQTAAHSPVSFRFLLTCPSSSLSPLKVFDLAKSQGRFLYASAPMVRYSKESSHSPNS